MSSDVAARRSFSWGIRASAVALTSSVMPAAAQQRLFVFCAATLSTLRSKAGGLADAGEVDQGQGLTIDLPKLDGGGEYIIVRLEPDGAGLVALVLRRKP